MESTSQSVGDFSNARGNAILTSTSTVRQSDFKNNVDFQASLGMHNLNKKVAMTASGACRPEFVDSHCVASTAIGTPPSSKTSALDTPTSLGAGGKRVGKKRTRASRRPPTTILEADSNNFRAMVQQLTGIPASPFFSPSLPRSRFEQLGSHLGGLVRPQSTSAAFPGQSSIPGLSMLDRALLQTENPTSLAHTSQAYTYGDILQSNEVTPFSFTLKQSSESQQLELDQPKSTMDFDKISEDSTKQLNSPSIFQPLGYSEAIALLSAKDQAPSLPADESHFWDSKADKSLRNISFNDLSKIRPVSVSKDTGCSEDQFYQKSMLDHLHGATDVDINSINNRTASPHIVDSWLSPAD
ncbi:hypothetical protein O6H91_06G123900 [Diphasiastrum complanatum]|nr:hypothetical protein O6H91_06G123900 [Diphasiastrum complanatum]